MPHFLEGVSTGRRELWLQSLVYDSVKHCKTMLGWLNSHPQAQLDASHPGRMGAQGAAGVRVTVPASWQDGVDTESECSEFPITSVCALEECRLKQVVLRLSDATAKCEVSIRAAADLHSMEIRLASAKAAIQAWFQAQQQPPRAAALPMSPYDLKSTPDALPLYEQLLVDEMGWDRLSFLPTTDEAVYFAQACPELQCLSVGHSGIHTCACCLAWQSRPLVCCGAGSEQSSVGCHGVLEGMAPAWPLCVEDTWHAKAADVGPAISS